MLLKTKEELRYEREREREYEKGCTWSSKRDCGVVQELLGEEEKFILFSGKKKSIILPNSSGLPVFAWLERFKGTCLE